MVDVVEVLIHLSIRMTERCRVISETGPLDPCHVLTWELNKFAHAGFPTPVSDALHSDRARVSSSAIAPPGECPTYKRIQPWRARRDGDLAAPPGESGEGDRGGSRGFEPMCE